MILSFAALAGIYVLLGAPLVAGAQVLVYIGAISVLILFAIMLTQSKAGPARLVFHHQAWAAAVLALFLVVIISVVVFATAWPLRPGPGGRDIDGHRALLFSSYVLPFEVVSMLLLAAVIGGVFLAKRETGSSRRRSTRPIRPRTHRCPCRGSFGATGAAVTCVGRAAGDAEETVSHDLNAYLILSGLLFAIGTFGFLARRNAIAMLMSIELMLNAVNLAIVAFGAFVPAARRQRRRHRPVRDGRRRRRGDGRPGDRHRHLPQPPHAAGRRVLEHAGVGVPLRDAPARRDRDTGCADARPRDLAPSRRSSSR